jgi:hypothetical protein
MIIKKEKKCDTNKNVTKMGVIALQPGSWAKKLPNIIPTKGEAQPCGATLCTNEHFAEHNAQCPPHNFIICAEASTCTENITGEEGQLPGHWLDRFMKQLVP